MTNILGSIKVSQLPELACFNSFEEFVLALSKYLIVELDDSTITNVVVSSIQPENPSRNVVWFKSNNAGSFSGIFVFSGGSWVQMFPAPNQVVRIIGDSLNPPAGYALIDENTAGVDENMLTFLRAQWYPIGSGPWTVYDAIYTGL